MPRPQRKKQTDCACPGAADYLQINSSVIFSVMLTSIYNLADTFFVGRLGTNEVSAVGIALPMMMVVQTFSLGFGQGRSNFISRLLGAKRNGDAESVVAVELFSTVGLSLLVSVFGFLPLGR